MDSMQEGYVVYLGALATFPIGRHNDEWFWIFYTFIRTIRNRFVLINYTKFISRYQTVKKQCAYVLFTRYAQPLNRG